MPACCTARPLLQYDVMSDLGNLEVGSGSHGGASKRAGSAGSPSAAASAATIPEGEEGEEAEEQAEQAEEERAAAEAAAAAEEAAASSNQEEVVGTGVWMGGCGRSLLPLPPVLGSLH